MTYRYVLVRNTFSLTQHVLSGLYTVNYYFRQLSVPKVNISTAHVPHGTTCFIVPSHPCFVWVSEYDTPTL